MGTSEIHASARTSSGYTRYNTCDGPCAAEGNLAMELEERQRMLSRFEQIVHSQEVSDAATYTAQDMKNIQLSGQQAVEYASMPLYYYDDEDTLAFHGRGAPEPYFAGMDTYGPTISKTIGQIRDAREEENGTRKAALEQCRNSMYKSSAFSNELQPSTRGDPLGLTSPRSSTGLTTMANAEVRRAEERASMLELMKGTEARPSTPTALAGMVGYCDSRPHVRTKPPPLVPCAW